MLEIRKFALREGVQEEVFEKFMIEEVFPVVRTVVDSRVGMHWVRHRLLKSETRTYWWTVEMHDEGSGTIPPHEAEVPVGEVQKVDWESIKTFPTDIGEELNGQLRSYATTTVSSPFRVLARTTEHITTPSPAWMDGNRGGWFGHG
jgi:hypothetical protein